MYLRIIFIIACSHLNFVFYMQTTNSTEFILIQLDRSLTFPSVEYIRYIVTKASNSGKNKLPLVIDCHHVSLSLI